MRILEITGEPIQRGGQEAFIINCISNINNADIHIDILTLYSCENEYYRSALATKGGKIYELNLPFTPGKSRKNIVEPLSHFLLENPYDAVHIHSGSISVLAYAARTARNTGIQRVIVHSHSTGIDNLKHRMVKLAFSHMLKNYPTDYCACTKEAGLMKFPAHFAENNLVILNNGIDINKFSFNQAKRTELRNKYGITDDEIVLGHVGRFSPEKNHKFMLEMLAQFTDKCSKVKLVFVGDGELRPDIEKLAMQNGIEDKVIFVGAADDIWNYYSMFDVFILPSLYEGFPFVALEAQASGLPCILSTGVSEDVVLCPHVVRIEDDVQSWTEEILKDSKLKRLDNREILRNRGYDIKNTVEGLLKLYLN